MTTTHPQQKGHDLMDYRLWLKADTTGRITLHGWSDTGGQAPDGQSKAQHWPVYQLCEDTAQLPQRLTELGLDLDAGADLGDLHRAWDVYLRHPDLPSLRATLDEQGARDTTAE